MQLIEPSEFRRYNSIVSVIPRHLGQEVYSLMHSRAQIV